MHADYKHLLTSLGWPVKASSHPGWAGHPRPVYSGGRKAVDRTQPPGELPTFSPLGHLAILFNGLPKPETCWSGGG